MSHTDGERIAEALEAGLIAEAGVDEDAPNVADALCGIARAMRNDAGNVMDALEGLGVVLRDGLSETASALAEIASAIDRLATAVERSSDER